MLTFHHLTRANKGSGGTTATTASISPASGRLAIATVLGSSATPGEINQCAGAGVTWQYLFDMQAASNGARWVSVFIGVGTGGSGALTFTSTTNQGDFWWSVFEVSSNLGTTPYVVANNVGESDASGTHTGLTVNLPAFANSANSAAGIFFWGGGSTITVGSGFTSIDGGSSGVWIRSQYKTNDNSVDASWSSANNWSLAVAMEISDIQSAGGYIFIQP